MQKRQFKLVENSKKHVQCLKINRVRGSGNMHGTAFLLCFLLSLCSVFCITRSTNINTYVKLEKYTMQGSAEDGSYICDSPYGLSGRPVFGGQIFSHIISCALKETEGYEVISGDCIFKDKTDKDFPIVYNSSVEALGSTIKLVRVEVLQEVGSVKKVRAVGSVLMHKKKAAIIQEGKKYIETISKAQSSQMLDYFEDAATDQEKLGRMKTSEEYWKGILKDEADYRKYIDTLHRVYSNIDIYMLSNKKNNFSRCIGYQLHRKQESVGPEPEQTVARTWTILGFISDEYILETALMPEGLCIVNSKYNILTLTHSVKFNDCERFDLNRPFFYDVKIDSIHNNIATCTGRIIQDQIVYANVCQTGKIFALQKAREEDSSRLK
ncbi:uncharacterized protein NEMAJ01_1638 [Nematocida major]|uniref:uncharacterized protein n=1 Tax=Nematocida major TaxID=1912982 RepID=UPI0020074A03|nr:uncharacterized protein NEMAJ01_1638 [Nematocida major]KAH9386742.1 hypothetical protein NEMAJ01_1638 [Nematocida major]